MTLQELPLKGIINTGNTCHFNAIMQAVMSCPIFVRKLLRLKTTNLVLQTLRELILQTSQQQRILQHLQTKEYGIGQECAYETYTRFIEAIPELSPLFQFKHNITLTCLKCKRKEIKEETSYSLVFDMQDNILHNRKEEVVERTCEHCGHGKSLQTKRISSYLPEIMVIIMPRYAGIYKPLPQELEIGTKRSTNIIYSIVAQIEHFGGLDGGHYAAKVCRYDKDGKRSVYHIDDSNVMRVEDITTTRNTFLVFYHIHKIQ